MTIPIDKRISVGSMIATGVSALTGIGIILGAVFWIGDQSRSIEEHNKRIEHTAINVAALAERVRLMETTSARQDERLLLILDTVRKIETKLDRAEEPTR